MRLSQLSDPFYAERPHLDFQVLRAAGLKHRGELSGKIWTDHNTHEPRTVHWKCCRYALIDLGYRAELPVADLFAKATDPSSRGTYHSPTITIFSPHLRY